MKISPIRSYCQALLHVLFAMACVVCLGLLLGFGFSAGAGLAGGLVQIVINGAVHGTP